MATALSASKEIRLFTQVAWLTALGLSQASALTIELDYIYDIGSDNFFGTNAAAKAAVEQAATDISTHITTELAPVTSSYSGKDGFTTTTFNWQYLFTNPTDGSSATIASPSLAANTIKIFVGVQEMADDSLASGGPGGVNLGISATSISPTYLQNALDIASVNSNNGIGRGAGPVIHNISNTSSFAGYPGSYDLDIGVGIGNLWFDVDTDNKRGTDDTATLDSFWHFDHTTSPAADKYDFYSVALHEILHTLGLGLSETWDDQISGSTNWTGSEAIRVNGTGNGLIESGSGHITSETTSARLSDRLPQIAAMASNLNQGERRELTELDSAILIDLGYTTVPEPTSLIFLGSIFPLLLFRRKK